MNVLPSLSEAIVAAASPRERRDVVRRARPDAEALRAVLKEAVRRRRIAPEASARLAGTVLAVARAGKDAALRAEASRIAGQTHLLAGRPRKALRRLYDAERTAAPGLAADLAPEIAWCLATLGRAEEALGLLGDARRRLAPNGGAVRRALLDLAEANLLQRLERPQDALPLLSRARRTFARRGEGGAVAAVDLNRANLLSNLDRYDAAERLYRRTTSWQRERGQEAAALQSDYNHAYLRFLRGRFHEALGSFHQVRSRFAALDDTRHVALCDLDEAEVNLRLNLPGEAAACAARAAHAFDGLGIAQDAARARFFAACAERGTKTPAESAAALDAARLSLESLGCTAWGAVALHRTAEAKRDAADLAGARADAAEAVRRLTSLGQRERAGRAEVLLASIESLGGDPAAALARLTSLIASLASLHAPWLRVEAHHHASIAAAALGRPRAALRHALRAARTLERHRVAVPPDEYMAAFLRDKADVHANAMRCVLKLGGRRATERAFELAEQSKARVLLDLLRHRPPASADPAARALCREADELGREIEGILGRLPSPDPDSRASDPVRLADAAAQRERRLSACLDRLAVRDPAAADARRATSPRLADVRAALPADTSLLEYFLTADELFAFLVTRDGLRIVRRKIDRRALRGVVARMRFHLDRPVSVTKAFGEAAIAALSRSAGAVLEELDGLLLADVREHLATPRVVVVPHAELHAVPFHALSRGGRALLEDHEVVLAPSTAVFLHHLRAAGTRRRRDGGCLVMGVPDEAAPLIAREVESVRGLHAGARVRIGSAATRGALAREGRGARVVHVASHANFREDDPMQSGLLLGDGWLTLGDVHRLRLDAEVLVLSGCATGRSWVSEGDDLFGLLSGFLRAGAANLVTSLWRVSDASSALFMESFHRALAGGAAPAAAIRSAALDVRGSFPHPHDWAPFVLTGTGGLSLSSSSRSAA